MEAEKKTWWTMSRRLMASHALAVLGGLAGWWLWGKLSGPVGALLALGLIVLIWIGASGWVQRSISLPLFRLRDKVRKIGERNTAPEIPLPSEDAIGELTDTVHATGERIDELLNSLWQTNRDLDRQLTKQTLELDERERSLESVVDTISHDLRSTALSMQALAGMLMERQGTTSEGKSGHAVRRLLAMTEFQDQLLRDLLTLVTIEKKPPKFSDVEIATLLGQVIEECQAEARTKNFRFRLPSVLPVVFADPGHLRIVFTHLVQNAIKFMGLQLDPEIEITLQENESDIRFAVRDNGIGIDPAYHEKIFQPFQRLGEIEAEGTGVGLSIVKQIVERSGGRIWVESKKGWGTTVFFTVPKISSTAIHRKVRAGG